MSRQAKPPIDRFWPKTVRRENGCIEWIAGRSKNGYALFSIVGDERMRTVLAHRWIFQECLGTLPMNVDVMHSCDNRACVALQHLSPGSRLFNMADARGKARTSQGIKRYNSKLVDDDVREIRRLLARGATQAAIAEQFGVHQVLISMIATGKIWRHVK